ncbi:unnamed protein product [Blepharisma stoltei]|uniref:Alpha/beta hydrolase n=1 Tax=Blepharisma stoltei TaxID=1481888 RepID=A0AAU9JTQ8_9CILI|nr:unnamed protein product [Blepharisma stoltei]
MEYFINRSGLRLAFKISVKYPDDKNIYIVPSMKPSEVFLLPDFIREHINANVFMLDLTGNGQSQGEHGLAGYGRDADDIDDAVKFLVLRGYTVLGIIGCSRYGTSAIHYAALYGEVKTIIAVAPKYHLIDFPEFIQRNFESIRNGNEVVFMAFGREWKFNKEMMDELINTNMKDYCERAKGDIYIIYGELDEYIPVSDASDYARELKEKCKGCYALNCDHFFMGVFDEVMEIIEKLYLKIKNIYYLNFSKINLFNLLS